MSEPYIGQVIAVGFNFAPIGWAFCNGAIMPISGNEALFSLIGTTYGGDGTTTFALPNLQSRAVVGTGTGPGLSNYVIGQAAGSETVTLLDANMPQHTHAPTAAATGTASDPASNLVFGAATLGGSQPLIYGPLSGASTVGLAPGVISSFQGGNQAHENRQPLLAINYIIAVEGIFPSRN